MLRSKNPNQSKIWRVIQICYLAFTIFILLAFNGIGDEADSITHFLIAKYASIHPGLFLDHWGKPVFTLIASPFAQFGFSGIKTFNALLTFLNFNLIYLLARKIGLARPYLASLFYILFPLTFITSYTGLTEPLCAFFILSSLLLAHNNHNLFAVIFISFTPFIRSEGLIMIGVWGLFLLYQKQYKLLPYLLFGHLTFAIIGAFYHESILWVFNKIPYSSLASPYGEGSWYHFLDKTTNMIGIPLYIMLALGFLKLTIMWFKKKLVKKRILLLISSLLLAFYIAHSLFWTTGIFNSMGLKRVFAAVTPLMAIWCLLGFNYFSSWFKGKVKQVIAGLLLIYILIFPFTSNPAAVDWPNDLQLTTKQQIGLKLKEYYETDNWKNKRLVYADPYISLVLDRKPFFNENQFDLRLESLNQLKKGDIVIWDNWHALYDNNLPKADLEKLQELKLLGELTKAGTTYYSIYEYTD